jgi:hypothetical protein
MARSHGLSFSNTFDTSTKGPLDSKTLVDLKLDLIDPLTWQAAGATNTTPDSRTPFYAYYGMLVVVNKDGDNNGLYQLKTGSATINYQWTGNINNWEKIGSGGSSASTDDGDDQWGV